jgi:AraC-like DNA-binding protein
MIFHQIPTRMPLSTCVSCLWFAEGFDGTHPRERLLPNGESCVVIDLRDEAVKIWDGPDKDGFQSFRPALFCGARTDCFVIDTAQQERVIGVQFRPGGAFPFLGMPASEVAHATYALDDVWPGEAMLLREELLGARDVAAMFRILERTLLARLRRSPAVQPVVNFAIANLCQPGANARVSDVAERAGLSSRRLIDLFRVQTGLAPKAFQRVRRFQQVLKTLRAGTGIGKCGVDRNWAELAAGCGFYDQAHFIHEFKLFSGLTPGEYVTLATPHLNHVPMA